MPTTLMAIKHNLDSHLGEKLGSSSSSRKKESNTP